MPVIAKCSVAAGADKPITDYCEVQGTRNQSKVYPVQHEKLVPVRGAFLAGVNRMRKLPLLMAAAAIGALGCTAGPSMASPLAGGLTNGTLPELNEGLVQ